MTKKDYEAIAECIRESGIDEKVIEDLENALAGYFKQDNPRFDRARFLAACRGEDSKDSAGRKVRYSERGYGLCSADGCGFAATQTDGGCGKHSTIGWPNAPGR
jgi:hypothetical protein